MERHPDERMGISGFEAHVPNEATIDDLDPLKEAMEETGLVCAMVTPNNHHYAVFRSASSLDPREQALGKARLEEAVRVGKELGTRTIVLWNGAEVYAHGHEVDWQAAIDQYISTLAYAADLAIENDMYIAIEPKPFEPGDEMIPNNSGFLLAMIYSAIQQGKLTQEQADRLGVNDEIGHVVMANCDVAQDYNVLRWAGKNFYAHLNRQASRGKHDTDCTLEMDKDTLAVIDALVTDPVFMSEDVARFAGFDYHPRHQHKGDQALLTLYANLARTRALEGVAHQFEQDPQIRELRDNHDYVALDAYVSGMIAEAQVEVEREIVAVSREGIPVKPELEERLHRLAI